ncbi:MAG: hypothetical protein IPG22_02595 [Acidobacteria bacterium]|nr:hypothetical protein [Acidobacteriota bacterium]
MLLSTVLVKAGVINPTGSPALVTIVNDDGLAFAVRFLVLEGAEGNVSNGITFTIDRIGDSSVASNVCYQFVAGTATEELTTSALRLGAANCVNFGWYYVSKRKPLRLSVIRLLSLMKRSSYVSSVLRQSTISVSPAGDRVATINDDGPIRLLPDSEGEHR